MLQISLLWRRSLRPRRYFSSFPYDQLCRMGRLGANRRRVSTCPFIGHVTQEEQVTTKPFVNRKKVSLASAGHQGPAEQPNADLGNGEAQAGGIGSLCNLKSGQWGKSQPGCSGSPLPLDGKSPGLLCSDCSGLWLKSHARASIWKDLTSTWKLTFNLLSHIFISWFFF